MALPSDVRKLFGHALDFAQQGDQHDAAKVCKCFGSVGILEVVEDDAGGTSRAVYTVNCKEAVFLLYGFQCSQKKRKSGIVTPKEDMQIICAWLKVAEAIAEEIIDGNALC